ncbi:MAG: NUDIX domain-containing protein, partial [Tepidiformaceae bacterium]
MSARRKVEGMGDGAGLPHDGSVVFLVDRDGRILLQQRDDDTPPAGYGRWGIPGGRREGAETPQETARREMLEEIGVELGQLRSIGVATPEDTEGLRARLHLLVSEDVVPRELIEVNEGLDFQYWHPDEAAELPMNPPARHMLARFINEGHYDTLVALRAQQTVGVAVIEIDRWGRFLLQLR